MWLISNSYKLCYVKIVAILLPNKVSQMSVINIILSLYNYISPMFNYFRKCLC